MLLNKNIKMIQKQLFSKISVVVKPVLQKSSLIFHINHKNMLIIYIFYFLIIFNYIF